MMPEVIVIIVLGLAFAAVIFSARKAKRAHESIQGKIEKLSDDEAREVLLQETRSSNGWRGKLDEVSLQSLLHRTSEHPVVEYGPASLALGTSDFDAPAILTDNFRIIGVIGTDDIAWICCRTDGEAIWELDGSENSEDERNASRFRSIYHYLLSIHRYYGDSSQ